ncbi:helical backbone metal receptor [uncultured Ezakiella sp.]|uniref:helical backbone metal receptor n=1 Tax=uncultured Ezakiella sp. TaxID=1637529 RepID=UPI0025EF8936|nr:helical backbone metal receptor [uncultured Ezakiella sp.]
MKQRLLALVLALMMIFSIGLSAAPQKVESKDLLTQNARSYIEADQIKNYGLKVEGKDKTVTVVDGADKISFTAGTNLMTVNGTDFTMDTKTMAKDGKVYIPFRILFETLNYQVGWDKAAKAVTLEKKAEAKLPVKNDKYEIKENHSKIVSIAPSVTETLFEIGAGDIVLGRSDYCNFPKEAEKVTSVGSMTEPDVEKLISLKPTCVIAQTHYKEEVLTKLQKAGIKVFAMDTPKSMEETYKSIETIGLITGKNTEARALVATMKAKLQSVERYTKKLSAPTAYIVVGTGQYGEYTHGKDSFMDDILRIAGLTNGPRDAEGFSYTLEKLIALNPHYMLVPAFALDQVKTDKVYKGLSAVNEGRVIEINADVFSRPSARVVDEGVKALLKIAHPDILNSLEF